MSKVSCTCAGGLWLSDTVIVTVWLPGVVGVPTIIPLFWLILKPLGKPSALYLLMSWLMSLKLSLTSRLKIVLVVVVWLGISLVE